jgi:diaminopimelate decarboxylase
MIVGNAGILVARVIYVKPGEAKNFVIIDAAMNDLIRPTLYEAHHDILPVRGSAKGARTITADVVGPVCETGDFLALGRKLADVTAGERLAVLGAGAYGFVMASNYNSRPRPAEVVVDGERWWVARPRETVEGLFSTERVSP